MSEVTREDCILFGLAWGTPRGTRKDAILHWTGTTAPTRSKLAVVRTLARRAIEVKKYVA